MPRHPEHIHTAVSKPVDGESSTEVVMLCPDYAPLAANLLEVVVSVYCFECYLGTAQPSKHFTSPMLINMFILKTGVMCDDKA